LLAAEILSLAGDQLAKVALTFVVYDATGSPALAALSYALTFVPALAGALGLARVADMRPRRQVLCACLLSQGALVALIATPGLGLIWVFALYGFAHLLGAVTNAALMALGRDIFDDDEAYLAAQDTRAVLTNVAMLAGLGVAGVLVAQLGPTTGLLVDAASFALAAGLVRLCTRARPRVLRPSDELPHQTAVLTALLRSGPQRTMLGLACLVGFAVVPEGLATPLAAELDQDWSAGWILAADPLGFTVGVLLLRRFVSFDRRARWVGPFAVISVLPLVAMPAATSVLPVLLLVGVSGAAGAYLVTVTSAFTSAVPASSRASHLGVYRAGLRGAQGIGVAAGGALAELVGVTSAIAVAGVLGAAAALRLARSWIRVST
jgi:predicted MFS family arabinose efflux permease